MFSHVSVFHTSFFEKALVETLIITKPSWTNCTQWYANMFDYVSNWWLHLVPNERCFLNATYQHQALFGLCLSHLPVFCPGSGLGWWFQSIRNMLRNNFVASTLSKSLFTNKSMRIFNHQPVNLLSFSFFLSFYVSSWAFSPLAMLPRARWGWSQSSAGSPTARPPAARRGSRGPQSCWQLHRWQSWQFVAKPKWPPLVELLLRPHLPAWNKKRDWP